MKASLWALGFAVLFPLQVIAGWRLDGDSKYTPPTPVAKELAVNTRTFHVTRDAAWSALVSYLAVHSFGIDQVSKDSGLLTLKFSAQTPADYIDCGLIKTWVSNMRGRRDYGFAGASASERYEFLESGKLYSNERFVTLSAGANVFVTSAGDTSSVRVNVRYVAHKRIIRHVPLDMDPPLLIESDITFNSGEVGSDSNGSGTQCLSTYRFERELLDGVEKEIANQAPQK